jgi:hypothetical protein
MVKSAELKAITAEVDKYKAAFGQFQLLYNGPPGDIANATGYWSTSGNGNGDGYVTIETSNEPFRAIQQLILAKLMDGSVTGTWGSGFVLTVPGTTGNVLPSSSNREGAAVYIKCCSNTDYSRTINFKNHVNLFSIYGTNITKRAGVLTPVEARNIDEKIDDGIPDYGMVGGAGSYTGSAYAATGCYTGTGNTSTYESSNATYKSTNSCQMLFGYDKD